MRPIEKSLFCLAIILQQPDTELAARSRYRSTVQTITAVAKESGALALWNGFTPYYCRCGGHTVSMFVFVELLRGLYEKSVS